MQVLTWQIGQQTFGMDLSMCREVASLPGIRKVPHSQPYLAGIANLRGEVVTVIDLRVLLGYEDHTSKAADTIVRLRHERHNLSILADSISDVIELAEGAIDTKPAGLNERESRFIQGIARAGAQVVVVLSAREILDYRQ